jgi:ribonuclease P protein component
MVFVCARPPQVAAKFWHRAVPAVVASFLPNPANREQIAVRQMRVRHQFLAANRGIRAHSGAFVLLVHPRMDDDPTIGIGFTVTKKVGNAVVRNRIKRRFRALAQSLLPQYGVTGADHVLIGKIGALEQEFAAMQTDMNGPWPKWRRKLPKQQFYRAKHDSHKHPWPRDDRSGAGLANRAIPHFTLHLPLRAQLFAICH